MTSYREAVKKFQDVSEWLTDEDLPAIVTLEHLADQLDSGDAKPATSSQFGLAYRSLLARKPKGEVKKSSHLEDLLKED